MRHLAAALRAFVENFRLSIVPCSSEASDSFIICSVSPLAFLVVNFAYVFVLASCRSDSIITQAYVVRPRWSLDTISSAQFSRARERSVVCESSSVNMHKLWPMPD